MMSTLTHRHADQFGLLRRVLVAGLFFSGLLGNAVHAQAPVVLADSSARVLLDSRHVQVLFDATGTINLAEARASTDWRSHTDRRRCFGFSDRPVWARFVWVDGGSNADWLLEISEKSLDDLKLYTPEAPDSFLVRESGDMMPFSEREIRHRNFVFSLLGSGAPADTVYIRFSSSGPMCLPMTLYSHVGFHQAERRRQFFLGGFFGLLVVMLFFNLFITISIRDRAYLWYIFYIAAYILYQLTVERIAFEYVWPNSPFWEQRSYGMFGLLVTVLTIEFSRVFLSTPNDVRLRVLDRLLRVLMWLAIPLALLNWFGARAIVNRSLVLYVLIVTLVLTAVAIQCFKIKKEPARYYLYAWSFLLAGTTVSMLGYLGVLPLGNLRLRAVQIGAAFELPVLALALGFKYKRQREERQRLLDLRRDAQQANRELKAKQERERLHREASQERERLEREASQERERLERVAAQERKRVEDERAREREKDLMTMIVHARLGHYITRIQILLGVAPTDAPGVDEARRMLVILHKEIRHLEDAFRIEVRDLVGLRRALVNCVFDVFKDSGVQANAYDLWKPDPDEENLAVPTNVALSAVYIVMEIANNAFRHAKATTFNVSVEHSNGLLRLLIWDDGVGLRSDEEDASAGRGTADIKDFARLVDGVAFGPENRLDGGVIWRVQLPCDSPYQL